MTKHLPHGGPAIRPRRNPIRVRIGYYYRGGSLDLDNILKAILDGLEGVAYTPFAATSIGSSTPPGWVIGDP